MCRFIKYIFLLALCTQGKIFAQYIEQYPINATNGDKMLEIKNYQEAVRQFSSLLKEEPKNVEYKFKLGKAYTLSTINQPRGLSILKELNELDQKPAELEFVLAQAYYKNYEIDQAKALFQKLLGKSQTEEEKVLYQNWIAQCDMGKKLMAHPVPVRFENLGDDVNSKAPDYLPLVSPDESIIMFTTRREGVVGNLYDYGGYRTADIYTAKHRRTKYTRARSVGSPNTYGNEETAGISENGEYMIYHVDSDDNYSDLYISQMGRRSYMPPGELNSESVNQKSKEPGGSLSNDGNLLFFCSDREGGLGGFDIYYCIRLPNGVWGEPINIGAPINTPKDEMYPFLRKEGSEIYFSSNGHPGMGELDLFKSLKVDQKWTQPVNLGYPINTPNDDRSICFTANPRYAYIASQQGECFGDLDIYRVVFEDQREELTLVMGMVMEADSTLIEDEILIEIFDRGNESLFGSYLSNPKKGNFMAILPPGKYRLEVFDAINYEDAEININLLDKNDFVPQKTVDLILKPKPKAPAPKVAVDSSKTE